MFKYAVLFSLTLLFIADDPSITWNSDYRLQWSDFQGKPKSRNTVVAVTASGLSFSYTTKTTSSGLKDYDFVVEAHFYPEQSWYLKERVTPFILEHERLHFDITELHARKFRKAIQNTRFTDRINREMNAIYDRITAELRDMQNRYDEETNHSINPDAQKRWIQFIAEELDRYKAYK